MFKNKITLKRSLEIVCIALLPFAIFYLFVVPALVANHTIAPSFGSLAFAAFLYIQFWMLTAECACSSAAHLYDFRRKYLWPFLHPIAETQRATAPASGFETTIFCILSYLFTIYGFAVAYLFVSRLNPAAFNVGELTLFKAVYFSLVTAATVGYGDITPSSTSTRSLVILEIVASLVYAVFFFSVLASGIRNRGQDDPSRP